MAVAGRACALLLQLAFDVQVFGEGSNQIFRVIEFVDPGPERIIEKTIGGKQFHVFDKVIIKASRVEDVDFLVMDAQLVPGQHLKHFIQGSKATG